MGLEILSNVIKGLKCPNTDYCDEGELMFSENPNKRKRLASELVNVDINQNFTLQRATFDR